MGLWSGVKDSGPQTVDFIPAWSKAGQILPAQEVCASKTDQSSSYNPNEKSDGTWKKVSNKSKEMKPNVIEQG